MEVKGITPGIYHHYKGADVEVVGAALHSETLEEFVVYKHLTGEHQGETNFWVRPRSMFLEDVTIAGKEIPRFEFKK
jgi:hypothetical protein